MRAIAFAGALLFALVAQAALSDAAQDRIQDAAAVLGERRGMPEQQISREAWAAARCVVVIPSVKKAAFVFGGEYGAGLMSCREGDGWSAPVFMELAKGSWGLQAGLQSTDLVLLVMNERGVRKLLQDKVTLGADASIAAGPVGRHARAATDLQMSAEILSYSRSQGVFAGLDLSGGVLKPDGDDNRALYGRSISPREVVLGGEVAAPPQAAPFLKALRQQDARPGERPTN